jgi:hypothetical protein
VVHAAHDFANKELDRRGRERVPLVRQDLQERHAWEDLQERQCKESAGCMVSPHQIVAPQNVIVLQHVPAPQRLTCSASAVQWVGTHAATHSIRDAHGEQRQVQL